MVDIVLVRPGFTREAERHWAIAPSLGVGYLAATVREAGVSVRVVDGKLSCHRDIEETVSAIRAHDPFVVGFSAMTTEFPLAREISIRLKRENPAIVTVLGGAHANAMRSSVLDDAASIDYVIAGEAEMALPELIRILRGRGDFDSVCGLHMRSKEKGIATCACQPIYDTDLSSLPFPAWDLFPRTDVYPVMTSRGCPWKCVFCCHNLSRRVRFRPVDHVVEEVRWLKQDFSPKEIYFEDDTFGIRPDDTKELLEKLIDLQKVNPVQFKAQTRVDRVSRDMFDLMKRAGFHYLELGVESGDPEVLSRSGKGVDLEQVEQAVRLAREAGLRVWLKFIVGLPGESEATVRRTRDLAVRLNPDRLSVSVIVAYPGCEIHEWATAGEQGYRLVSRDWSDYDKYAGASVELDTMSYRDMRRWQSRIYAEVYLRNIRLIEFSRLVWQHRELAFSVFRDAFRPLGSNRSR